MSRRAACLTFLAALLSACAVTPSAPTKPPAAAPSRGLSVEPYHGRLAKDPLVARALSALPATLSAARSTVRRRLGLALDPHRPRRFRLSDSAAKLRTRTMVESGRSVELLEIPATWISRDAIPVRSLTVELVARAAVADRPMLPDWYRLGAPVWVSGRWLRLMHRRLLAGRTVERREVRLAPPLELHGQGNDPLTGALFLRFLEREFGAEKVSRLAAALSNAESVDQALSAALGANPGSLPDAFDAYRGTVLDRVLADPDLIELEKSRKLAADDRIRELSGLGERCTDPFVGAAMLEELAHAEFGEKRYTAAADTLARIEAGYTEYAFHLDRDRLEYALTLLRRGRTHSATLRLKGLLAQFPHGEEAARARLELARMDLSEGAVSRAVDRLRKVVEDAPKTEAAQEARLALAKSYVARFLYGDARKVLVGAKASAARSGLLAEIERVGRAGLSAAASKLAVSAVSRLAEGSVDAGDAEKLLSAIGPAAAPEIRHAFTARVGGVPGPAVAARLVRVAVGWSGKAGEELLAWLAGVPDAGVGASVVQGFQALGASPDHVASLLAANPHASRAAYAAYRRVFGNATGLPAEVADLVTSKKPRDRALGARRLATVAGAHAVAALAKLLDDPSVGVRRAAAAALANHSGVSAFAALRKALADAAPAVREEALLSLSYFSADDLLRKCANTDPSPSVREAAAGILAANGSSSDLEVVVGLLADPDPSVGDQAQRLLSSCESIHLGTVLAKALEHAKTPGIAARIAAAMSSAAGRDFGYAPGGGPQNRVATAHAFAEYWSSRTEGAERSDR